MTEIFKWGIKTFKPDKINLYVKILKFNTFRYLVNIWTQVYMCSSCLPVFIILTNNLGKALLEFI